MVAFDVYRSVGPNVSVSLFGDAAKTGAALGNAIPSFIESAVTGAQAGYKYGQEAVARSQENEIRQHQIDRLDESDRAQDAQIQNAETINRINQLKLKNAEKLNTLEGETEESKLTNDGQKIEQEIALRAKRKEFLTNYENADSKGKAEIFGSGAYRDVLSVDKDLFNQVGGEVYRTGDNGLSQVDRDRLGQTLKIRAVQSSYQKELENQIKNFNQAKAAVPNDDLTAAIKDTGVLGDIPLEQYPFHVTAVQAGRFKRDASNKIEVDEYGAKVENPGWRDLAENKDKLDFITDTGYIAFDGTSDFNGISTKGNKLYKQMTTSASYVSGEQERLAVQQITNPPQSQVASNQGTSPVEVATFGGNIPDSEKIPPLPEDKLWADLEKSLDVPAQAKATVSEPLANLSNQIANYAAVPSLRNNPLTITKINESITSVARGVSDAQFQANPVVKQQFNQASVENYNRGLVAKLSPTNFMRTPISGARYDESTVSIGLGNSLAGQTSSSSASNSLYNAFKVDTPEDLYFLTQQAQIERQIASTVYGAAKREQQKQQQPVNAQISKQNRNNILFKEAVR